MAAAIEANDWAGVAAIELEQDEVERAKRRVEAGEEGAKELLKEILAQRAKMVILEEQAFDEAELRKREMRARKERLRGRQITAMTVLNEKSHRKRTEAFKALTTLNKATDDNLIEEHDPLEFLKLPRHKRDAILRRARFKQSEIEKADEEVVEVVKLIDKSGAITTRQKVMKRSVVPMGLGQKTAVTRDELVAISRMSTSMGSHMGSRMGTAMGGRTLGSSMGSRMSQNSGSRLSSHRESKMSSHSKSSHGTGSKKGGSSHGVEDREPRLLTEEQLQRRMISHLEKKTKDFKQAATRGQGAAGLVQSTTMKTGKFQRTKEENQTLGSTVTVTEDPEAAYEFALSEGNLEALQEELERGSEGSQSREGSLGSRSGSPEGSLQRLAREAEDWKVSPSPDKGEAAEPLSKPSRSRTPGRSQTPEGSMEAELPAEFQFDFAEVDRPNLQVHRDAAEKAEKEEARGGQGVQMSSEAAVHGWDEETDMVEGSQPSLLPEGQSDIFGGQNLDQKNAELEANREVKEAERQKKREDRRKTEDERKEEDAGRRKKAEAENLSKLSAEERALRDQEDALLRVQVPPSCMCGGYVPLLNPITPSPPPPLSPVLVGLSQKRNYSDLERIEAAREAERIAKLQTQMPGLVLDAGPTSPGDDRRLKGGWGKAKEAKEENLIFNVTVDAQEEAAEEMEKWSDQVSPLPTNIGMGNAKTWNAGGSGGNAEGGVSGLSDRRRSSGGSGVDLTGPAGRRKSSRLSSSSHLSSASDEKLETLAEEDVPGPSLALEAISYKSIVTRDREERAKEKRIVEVATGNRRKATHITTTPLPVFRRVPALAPSTYRASVWSFLLPLSISCPRFICLYAVWVYPHGLWLANAPSSRILFSLSKKNRQKKSASAGCPKP